MPKLDYTKYKLKNKEELLNIIGDNARIYIVSCNKCFSELKSTCEPETAELNKLLNEAGKTTAGFMPLDFLCNEHLSEKALNSVKQDILKADAVAVISCGIGIQTVAGLLALPVLGMCDSVFQGGYHGISLNTEKCGACGDCYLTATGGICPVVDCSKGLINGPCGGAKNSKCEVSKDKDCAWESIYNRLKSQNRQDVFISEAPKIRNYNKNNADFMDSNVKRIQAKRNEGFYGGLYPEERKELTEKLVITKIADPEIVSIPLQQHAGAVCEALVKAGERVSLGQKIGASKAFVSAYIHSSVSGEVLAVEPRKHPLLPFPVLNVIIKNDKKDEIAPSVASKGSLSSCTGEAIVQAIKDAGVVGMGGAQFPTHIKLSSAKVLDTVLINGCECEPLLNADNRLMIERPEQVLTGLRLIMKAAGISKGIIALEDNKIEAFESLKSKLAGDACIEVISVRTKYPEGAERMLIKRVLNREVPRGGLPLDVGVIVNNISTVVAVYEAVYNGLPLVRRVVTVAGAGVEKPGNYEIKIGMQVADIARACGIKVPDNFELKMGGAIMGFVQDTLDVPVIKGTNGIIVVRKKDELTAEPCIKCGRCVNVCPMELKPHKLVLFAQAENWEMVEKEGVMNCIECGCCEDICSSKSHMVEIFKSSKKALKERKK